MSLKEKKVVVKVYPASAGDCFLVSISDTHILIDGGYVDTYTNYLKSDLMEINRKGQKISHLIVTHIDQDHISGILKFIKENNDQDIVPISNVWHNSYRHIQADEKPHESWKSNVDKRIDELVEKSYLKDSRADEKKISAEQGSSLAGELLKGNFNWNSEFDEGAVCIETRRNIEIGNGIKIRLLSPNQEKLRKLENRWKKELRIKGFLNDIVDGVYYDDAFEFMVAKEKDRKRFSEKSISKDIPNIDLLSKTKCVVDKRPANGSSIAFVLEYDGLRFLFAGDAHPDLLMDSLLSTYEDEVLPVYFDFIKVAHHGSWANNCPGLLDVIDSPINVFSTNGNTHNHPDRETLAYFIKRPTKEKRELYFNYPLEVAQSFDVDSLKKKYNYEVQRGSGFNVIELNF